MRTLAPLLALVLSLSTAAFAQLTPERPLPGLPPLQGPADPAPDQDQQQQAPDATPAPPDQQSPQGQQAPGQAPQAQGPRRPVPRPPESDDQLLEKLSKAASQRDARPIERELRARWAHSPSPSADLLLKRIDQAMRGHDTDTARRIAQKLTEIAPDFAEAWHRRATLAEQKDDYSDAIESLRHVLSLQPRHFVALAELGEILEEFGDKPRALEVYRKAKALDPYIDGMEDRIRALTKDVEGQGI